MPLGYLNLLLWARGPGHMPGVEVWGQSFPGQPTARPPSLLARLSPPPGGSCVQGKLGAPSPAPSRSWSSAGLTLGPAWPARQLSETASPAAQLRVQEGVRWARGPWPHVCGTRAVLSESQVDQKCRKQMVGLETPPGQAGAEGKHSRVCVVCQTFCCAHGNTHFPSETPVGAFSRPRPLKKQANGPGNGSGGGGQGLPRDLSRDVSRGAPERAAFPRFLAPGPSRPVWARLQSGAALSKWAGRRAPRDPGCCRRRLRSPTRTFLCKRAHTGQWVDGGGGGVASAPFCLATPPAGFSWKTASLSPQAGRVAPSCGCRETVRTISPPGCSYPPGRHLAWREGGPARGAVPGSRPRQLSRHSQGSARGLWAPRAGRRGQRGGGAGREWAMQGSPRARGPLVAQAV